MYIIYFHLHQQESYVNIFEHVTHCVVFLHFKGTSLRISVTLYTLNHVACDVISPSNMLQIDTSTAAHSWQVKAVSRDVGIPATVHILQAHAHTHTHEHTYRRIRPFCYPFVNKIPTRAKMKLKKAQICSQEKHKLLR